MKHAVSVRKAERSDLPEIVRVHTQSFAGQLGVSVGERYLTAFLRWFMETPGAVALVADDQGELCGYVFGAVDGYGTRINRDLLPHIAIGVLTHLPAVLRHPSVGRQLKSRLSQLLLRREPKSLIFAATPPGCFSLVGIGTAPTHRGRGVGQALVLSFCREVGDRPILLDVFRDNTVARSLYERHGFRTIAEEGRVLRMIRPAGSVLRPTPPG